MKTVAVCTPWFNHLELLDDYIAAMKCGPYPDELTVVDNGSTPPLSFARIRNRRNHGFAQASNQGLFAVQFADVVVFLNNDVRATGDGWLRTLADACEPGVLAGPQIRHDAHGSVDGVPYPYLDGWCVAGMRSDLLALGGFDCDYRNPGYYTDNDLSLRARASGMVLREVPLPLEHKLNRTAAPMSANPFAAANIDAAAVHNRERFQKYARLLHDDPTSYSLPAPAQAGVARSGVFL
jgi:GT2 family glycosyltransferase